MPVGAEEAHEEEVVVAAVAVDVGAEAAFFAEAAGGVGADGALVAGVDAQPEFVVVVVLEGVRGEAGDGFAAVAAPPVGFVADGDAEFGGAADGVAVEEGGLTDEAAVGFDGEVGSGAAAFAGFLVKFGLEAGEGLGQGWVAAAGEFDFDVVVIGEQEGQVFAFDGAEADEFSL